MYGVSRAHNIQLCLQEAFVPAGVKSLTANRQELISRDNVGATWAEEGMQGTANIDIFRSAHNKGRYL